MKKKKIISVRCTDIEVRALELLAQREQRNKSEMLREIIRETAQAAGVWDAAQGRQVARCEFPLVFPFIFESKSAERK